ncbi:hypothetical protein [Bradyrhizobium liaoningense]|uniref:hypothetical protein n=1 Tax=Bradyrhizobium liaoningense TaxID=43992 RepID=UPI001BA52FDD|nr:hypothetical protein [Bradyrhizobium liaoningense]MBR1170524.1 hypothetical protein [Bradyrhizobium liaoningense]
MDGMTQAEYARHRGVSRQAISKLISSGKIPASAFVPGEGGARLINAAAADHALGEGRERVLLDQAEPDDLLAAVDSEVAAPRASTSAPVRPEQHENIAALTKARTETEIYRAERARIELEEKRGKLLKVEDVVASMEKCAAVIVRELEVLPNFADEIAAAIAKDGAGGARSVLKRVAREVRTQLEQNMRLAAAADRDVEGEPQ